MTKNRILLLGALALGLALLPGLARAQQRIGYIDSEYLYGKIPEFATVQQQLDRMVQEWQKEVDEEQKTVDGLFQEYQARELLYTQEERQRRREEIVQAEGEVDRLRHQYFGPEGQLFTQQEALLKPIQERILTAVEEVAAADGYDYVFDKSGDFLFMYAKEQFDLSDRVLEELGIEVESTGRTTNQ